MQRLCADVELLARGGELAGVPPLLDAIEAEFADFRAALERTTLGDATLGDATLGDAAAGDASRG
jgi:hypothetical protein